jgi:hypothetical protein
MMKTARIHDYAASPVIDEVGVPEIGADEVLIRVKAASLNPLDLLLQGGKRRDVFPLPFPYTLGTDLSGTVEKSGSLAARWRSGDRVVARLDPTRGGALAEFAVVPAAYVATTCACRKSNPNILMMQSAQDRTAKNMPGSVNHGVMSVHPYPTISACAPHCNNSCTTAGRHEDVARRKRQRGQGIPV